MERALLARHGESVFGARGLATGRVDVRCPLTERGAAQARALAEEISDEDIDLCVTSELERACETAEIALAQRSVRRIVLAELNDPLYGGYEGGPLDAYLAWAHENDSAAEPPGGGEGRQALVARYAAGFRTILARPERSILVVAHSLPIAYVLMALAGREPAPRVPLVEHAKTHAVSAGELARAIARLEAWRAAPSW
ncbi:MAG TPA: histidine phosphatase family protein [Gaiellaceae bacterium]|nr:histidine phosphatase family protein [Gaiellaceae bacterium]